MIPTVTRDNVVTCTWGEVVIRGRLLMNSSQGERWVSLLGSQPGGDLIPVGLGDFFR